MTPQDIQAIHGILMTRVQPRDVREGIAIAALATKLAQHFAPKAPSPTREDSTFAPEPAAQQHAQQGAGAPSAV